MTRFVPLSSAAALMLALAGCGAEPAQKSDITTEQGEVVAGEPPAMVETMPVAQDAQTTSGPAVPTEEAKPPEKSHPKQEAVAKAAVPPRAKLVPEAPKPVEPDPHAGQDMDKM